MSSSSTLEVVMRCKNVGMRVLGMTCVMQTVRIHVCSGNSVATVYYLMATGSQWNMFVLYSNFLSVLMIPLHPLLNKQMKKSIWHISKILGCMNLSDVTFGCAVTKHFTSFLSSLISKNRGLILVLLCRFLL